MQVEGFELKDAVIADGERVKMYVEGVVRENRVEPDVIEVVTNDPEGWAKTVANTLDPEGTNRPLRQFLDDWAARSEGFAGFSDDELKGTARDIGPVGEGEEYPDLKTGAPATPFGPGVKITKGANGGFYVPGEFFDANGLPVEGLRRLTGAELAELPHAEDTGSGA